MATTAKQMEYNRRWKTNNKEKVAAQMRRYRNRHPEKFKALSKLSVEKKIIKNIGELTRNLFNDKLPKYCEKCGSTKDLNIHHKRYTYPIIKSDLVRLCHKCHVETHNELRKQTKYKIMHLDVGEDNNVK